MVRSTSREVTREVEWLEEIHSETKRRSLRGLELESWRLHQTQACDVGDREEVLTQRCKPSRSPLVEEVTRQSFGLEEVINRLENTDFCCLEWSRAQKVVDVARILQEVAMVDNTTLI